ncbi:SecDF P1 head subdomain-containing protein [Actinomadura gamaensis]|uniref:SecDF P1 head subdomain domain-containing protein n=1 Tax=Actinomadura gamaensis TaxID=1763541 RepID=A0ABV9UCU4_9ACTN
MATSRTTLRLNPDAQDAEDPDARRRARSIARQRQAAEVKRSRAELRGGRARQDGREQAVREHRAALVTMILTLGILIAAVAVTGGLIANSMRDRPVTLAAPLQVFPVTQTSPGQCPAGTQGVTGQTTTGLVCYQLAQGIAIRKVSDLRVQRGRSGSAYDVAVTLRPSDRKAFAQLTRATVGRDVAFVVSNRLITAPRVEMPITDGKVVITGTPDHASANRLVHDLKGR